MRRINSDHSLFELLAVDGIQILIPLLMPHLLHLYLCRLVELPWPQVFQSHLVPFPYLLQLLRLDRFLILYVIQCNFLLFSLTAGQAVFVLCKYSQAVCWFVDIELADEFGGI